MSDLTLLDRGVGAVGQDIDEHDGDILEIPNLRTIEGDLYRSDTAPL